jgi:hypothetical protein
MGVTVLLIVIFTLLKCHSLILSRATRRIVRTSAALSGQTKLREFLESSLETCIAETDRGSAASSTTVDEAKELIKALEGSALDEQKDYLSAPQLMGNYDVSFVVGGSSQRGNPAGGGYRGAMGKFFFHSTGIFQNILPNPNPSDGPIVVNFVRGILFGIIPFSVILKGIARPLNNKERQAISSMHGVTLGPAVVRASFEPPVLSFGDPGKPISVRVGPQSSVVLDTPYLSDRLRLGRGSRGSLFVFSRTADTAAALWQRVLTRRTLKGRPVGAGLLLIAGSLAVLAHRLPTRLRTQTAVPLLVLRCLQLMLRLVAVPVGVLGSLLLGSRGGILE